MTSAYFAALDLPLSPDDALAAYRPEDHHPEVMALRKLMIVQFGGCVAADVLMRALTGNGLLAGVMFALVFGHMATVIAPRRVALRRKLAILRMKADQLGFDPQVAPHELEATVADIRARLNRLAALELIAVPLSALVLAAVQILAAFEVIPSQGARVSFLSIPAIVLFTAFHEWRFRKHVDARFPLPRRAAAGD